MRYIEQKDAPLSLRTRLPCLALTSEADHTSFGFGLRNGTYTFTFLIPFSYRPPLFQWEAGSELSRPQKAKSWTRESPNPALPASQWPLHPSTVLAPELLKKWQLQPCAESGDVSQGCHFPPWPEQLAGAHFPGVSNHYQEVRPPSRGRRDLALSTGERCMTSPFIYQDLWGSTNTTLKLTNTSW